MATVTVPLSVGTYSYPAGTALGKFRVQLTKAGTGTLTQLLDAPLPSQVTFTGVTPGTWTFNAQQLSPEPAVVMGPLYSASVVVPEPAPVVGPVVTGATFTVS
jgi:hypothetical protein